MPLYKSSTASPQNIGTSYSSGETQIFSGALTLASNGAAPPTVSPPAIKLFGYCGGATGNNGWDIGIDTANHGGGQDFYLGKVVNGGTQDIFFVNYATTAMGLAAATPPNDVAYLEILSPAASTMNCLSLGVGSGATGNALSIYASSGTPQIWVDPSFIFRSVAGGNGVQFAAEATNNRVLALCNNANTRQYAFVTPEDGSNALRLRYTTGNVSIWDAGTNGSMTFYNNIGFYGKNPVARPTAGAVTAGFTANSGTAMNSASTSTGSTGATAYTFGDVVTALKTLGLITT